MPRLAMFRLCENGRRKSLPNVRTNLLASAFVMCEHWEMLPITYSDLAAAAGISRSYANEILNGKRAPSRSLAIHIFRKTEWRHDSIADLTDDQLEMLEQIEPWSSRQAA